MFRITDGLLCYRGINCNWKLMFERCDCLWHTEWEVIFMQSVCLVVFHCHTDLEKLCKELQNLFSSNFLCTFSVKTIIVAMSCCQNTLLQIIQCTISLNTHHSVTSISWQLHIMKLTVASHYNILVQPCSNVTSCCSLYRIVFCNIKFRFTQLASLRILCCGCFINTLSRSQSR